MTESSPPDSPAEGGFSLPFDPLRLLGGVRRRWRWVLAGAVAGTVLGLTGGFFRAATRHEVAVRLMRRDVPATFRVGEIGEAFKPRTINGATLIGVALSDNVLGRVAARSTPRVSLGLLRGSVEAREQRGTDFVTLILSGYHDATATVQLINTWADEVVQFSREMQARESREARLYLQQQLERTDADLARINGDILAVAQREGIVNADKQIDAYLRTLGDLDLRVQTTRIDLQTAEQRLQNVAAELSRLNPLRDRLAATERELDEALKRLAEKNPVVLDLQERTARLKSEVEAQPDQPPDATALAGSALGSALYLQSLELRAQVEGLQKQLAQLQEARAQTQAQLAAVPEKSAPLSRLLQSQRNLEEARSMLFARLREAQHFEERAPGYFQIFSAADIGGVATSPRWLKLLVFAFAGLIVGGAAGVGAGVAAELIDSRLRTAAEAARIYAAPIRARLPRHAGAAEWLAAVERLWLSWFPPPNDAAPWLAVWSPLPTAEDAAFWQAVTAEADRLLDGLVVLDAGAEPCAFLAGLPAWSENRGAERIVQHRIDPDGASLAEVRRVMTALRADARRAVCVRLTGPVREPATTLARACRAPLVLVAADAARLDFWADHSRLLTAAVAAPAGVVLHSESLSHR